MTKRKGFLLLSGLKITFQFLNTNKKHITDISQKNALHRYHIWFNQ
ncbi:hypothetical protein FLAVO9AF_30103 [Flavobacterium sp. 9AF]|nr:hypothetical protein FLAVO9AF_30103 [Flavobacterium sp. 9AF]